MILPRSRVTPLSGDVLNIHPPSTLLSLDTDVHTGPRIHSLHSLLLRPARTSNVPDDGELYCPFVTILEFGLVADAEPGAEGALRILRLIRRG